MEVIHCKCKNYFKVQDKTYINGNHEGEDLKNRSRKYKMQIIGILEGEKKMEKIKLFNK